MTVKRKLITVTLKQAHTHHDKPCQPGDSIDVTVRQAEWLARHGKVDAKPGGYQPAKTSGPKATKGEQQ